MCWLWSIDGGVISLLCLFTGLIWSLSRIKLKYTSKDILTFILCLSAFLICAPKITFLVLVSRVVLSLNVVLLLKWPISILDDLFQYIYTTIAIILIPSIIFYILDIYAGVSIPSFTQHSQDLGYIVENHIFYVVNPDANSRFCGYFCEPGHLATIMSLLLLCSRCNIKDWRTKVILVAILLTMSLAGYVITGMAFFVKSITAGRLNKIIKSLIGVFTIFLIVLFAFKISGNYDQLDELIFQRLIFDSDTGKLSGDNRVSYATDLFIATLDLNTLFLGGIDIEQHDLVGTGVKMYVLQFGIIGVIATYLMYYNILKNRPSKYGTLCLIVFAMSFIQRCYAIWFCQIFIFIYCVTLGYKIKNNERHHLLNNNS